ncbi:MAG: 2-C-methyl-D-erythritol 4-phosphate cytidylyltransferase [Lachnospiraceae bacterium]|nr:2-C-methyl-D-erythritol 4-phosphate cytidylyltransferase [Lachnospiraceae bacterium]
MVIGAIVAGGTGRRMGTAVPKQFLKLGNRTILLRSVDAFLDCDEIDKVIVGVPKEWVTFTKQLLDEAGYGERRSRVKVTEGGANRNETMWKITEYAVERLHADDMTIMVTHDAVRPFVTDDIIRSTIKMLVSCDEKTGVTAAVPCTDTILRIGANAEVVETPKRINMMQAQTPQTVYLGTWRKVYKKLSAADREFRTDISGMYISAGLRVKVVDGDRGNSKITTPEDYEAAKRRVQDEENNRKEPQDNV